MIEDYGDLDVIQFSRGEDDRVIMHGLRLPFMFGRLTNAKFIGDCVFLTIKRDYHTELKIHRQMELWGRFKRWIGWGTAS